MSIDWTKALSNFYFYFYGKPIYCNFFQYSLMNTFYRLMSLLNKTINPKNLNSNVPWYWIMTKYHFIIKWNSNVKQICTWYSKLYYSIIMVHAQKHIKHLFPPNMFLLYQFFPFLFIHTHIWSWQQQSKQKTKTLNPYGANPEAIGHS